MQYQVIFPFEYDLIHQNLFLALYEHLHVEFFLVLSNALFHSSMFLLHKKAQHCKG